jgi:hypothetical protein
VTGALALASLIVLIRWKVPEPLIVLGAAIIGIVAGPMGSS